MRGKELLAEYVDGELESQAEDMDGKLEGQDDDMDEGSEGQAEGMEFGIEAQAEDNVVQEDPAEDPLGVAARLRYMYSKVTKRLAEEGTEGDRTNTDEQVETEDMGGVKHSVPWAVHGELARHNGTAVHP